MNHLPSFPADEPVVGMLDFNGRLFIATTRRIYVLKENKLTPLEIVDDRQSQTQEPITGGDY